jgi:hypothetical protein
MRLVLRSCNKTENRRPFLGTDRKALMTKVEMIRLLAQEVIALAEGG